MAWSPLKNPYDLFALTHKIHTITECMDVRSEPGDYIFKKFPKRSASSRMSYVNLDQEAMEQIEEDPMTVCGLYIIGEPDTIVEVTIKQYNVNCESGGLMAFVDGWELNGEYFPSEVDHHRKLEDRVVEFCSDYRQWPKVSNKKFFKSSQNAALLQYRIPTKGFFIANVKFHKISQPCNVLVQDTDGIFQLNNYGHPWNCTIAAIFPAVVSLSSLKIGSKALRNEKVNYDCQMEDRLDIGGSGGLENSNMDKSSSVCGYSDAPGPQQALFCGTTSVRLVSSGKYSNQATVEIRKASVEDYDLATLICPV
ncbi:CRHBP family protein [Megaselia abdita]